MTIWQNRRTYHRCDRLVVSGLLAGYCAIAWGLPNPALSASNPTFQADWLLSDRSEELPKFPLGSRILELGQAGTDVAQLQEQLRELDYWQERVTGVFDRATQAAIVQFQQDRGLRSDGRVGRDTLQALEFARLEASLSDLDEDSLIGLRRGDRGFEVQQLQLLLQQAGFYPNAIDGRFETNTEAAVLQFQRNYSTYNYGDNRLTVSGVVDEPTLAILTAQDPILPVTTSAVRVAPSIILPPPNLSRSRDKSEIYAIVIPIGDNPNLWQEVRQIVPNARYFTSDRRGDYIDAGSYSERDFAQSISDLLKAKGFDARVVYFDNREVEASAIQPIGLPSFSTR
jgi:peptidoglycan hydrolase-like protein with peptidoglycan-binding domain